MAQRFHFEHHRREAMTNRRRFNMVTAVLVTLLVGGVYFVYRNFSQAATNPANNPPQVSLTANGASGNVTVYQNGSLTLAWSAPTARSCKASGYSTWTGTKAVPSGSEDHSADTKNLATITYSLSCSNSNGSNTAAVTVKVEVPPPTLSLAANGQSGSAQVQAGHSLSLNWSSANAANCQASGNWSGSKALTGSENRSSDAKNATSLNYILTCHNSQQVAVQANVKVTVTAAPAAPAAPTQPAASPPSPTPPAADQPTQSPAANTAVQPPPPPAATTQSQKATPQSVIAVLATSGTARLVLIVGLAALLLAAIFLLRRRSATDSTELPQSDSAAIDIAGAGVVKIPRTSFFGRVGKLWDSTEAFFATDQAATQAQDAELEALPGENVPKEAIPAGGTLDSVVAQLKERPEPPVPAPPTPVTSPKLSQTHRFGAVEAGAFILLVLGVFIGTHYASRAASAYDFQIWGYKVPNQAPVSSAPITWIVPNNGNYVSTQEPYGFAPGTGTYTQIQAPQITGWTLLGYTLCYASSYNEAMSCPAHNQTPTNQNPVGIYSSNPGYAGLWWHWRQNLPPAVSITANGNGNTIAIYTGSKLTIAWNTSNQPSSCNAASSPSVSTWSGARGAAGSEDHTGDTGSPRVIRYTLTCSNPYGSSSATVTVDIKSRPAPPPPPAPAPPGQPPAPAPAPAPQPAPTPTQSLSVPQQFTAGLDQTVVALSWTAATGVDHYELDRSTDQQNWDKLSDTISGDQSGYLDRDVKFSTHYFYRLKAFDASGNASDYATVDVTTGDFSANAQSGDTTVTSDDGFASVVIPAGSVDANTQCSLALAQDQSGLKQNGSDVLRGPYVLDCKNASGDAVTDFKKPVQLALGLTDDQLKKYGAFAMMEQDSGGNWVKSKSAKYDSKSKAYIDLSSSPKGFALLGSVKKNYLPLLLSILFPVVIVFGGIIFVRMRQNKTAEYNDYIRRKYYNL